MAGNKNSGRRPEAYEETIIRKRTPIKDSERTKVRDRVNLVLKEHDRLDVGAFLLAAFSIDQVQEVWVERILPGNQQHVKVGKIVRATLPDMAGDAETWLLNTYKSGSYAFKAAMEGVWVGPMHVVRLGLADSLDAGFDAGADVDGILASVARRESNIASIRQLRDVNRAPETAKEDEMKLGEVVEIVKLLKGDGPSSDVALLREELREIKASLAARTTTPWEALSTAVPALVPLFPQVAKFVPRGLIGRLLMNLVPPEAKETEPAPPPSFADQAMGLLGKLTENPAIAQAIAPLLQLLTMKLQAAPGGTVTAAPQAAMTDGGVTMATFKTVDPDIQEQLNYFIAAVGERKFPEAFGALVAYGDVFGPYFGSIASGIDPVPFWNKLKTLDDRLRVMEANGIDFIRYVQAKIEADVAAAQKAEEGRGGGA